MRTTGLRGRGIVTGISDTGVTINMNPLVAFHMRIEVPGVQPYETTVRHQVNRLQVGSLRPGIVVPVLADPQLRGEKDAGQRRPQTARYLAHAFTGDAAGNEHRRSHRNGFELRA